MRSTASRRYILATAMVALVTGLLVVQWVEGRQSAGRTLGYYLQEVSTGVVVSDLEPGLPADRAGVEEGDRLVAVDGMEIRRSFDYDVAAERFERGLPVTVEVERRAQTLQLRLTPGVAFGWRDYWTNALVALVHLALAVLVLVSGVTDRRATLLVVLAAAVAIELALPLSVVGKPLVGVLAAFCLWGLNGLQFGVELHLASLIPGRRPWFERRRWIIPSLYGLGVGWGAVKALSELPSAPDWRWMGWVESRAGEVLVELAYLVWPLGVFALLTTAATRWPERVGRRQALVVLVGVTPWVLLASTISYGVLRGELVPLWIDGLSPYVLVLYPVAIFLALFRYELLGFDRALVRGFAYSILTASVVAVFYGSIGLLSAFSPGLIGGGAGSVWVIAGATLVLGLSIAPLQRRVQSVVERRLLPERTILQERLAALARELPRRGQLREIARGLVDEAAAAFDAEGMTVLLAEETAELLVARASSVGGVDLKGGLLLSTSDPFIERLCFDRRTLKTSDGVGESRAAERLAELGVELAVPILVGERLIGVLAVGPKRHGSYTAGERGLLDLFGTHVASVLENAVLFESATVDPLTGVLRREAILEQLDREVDRARRYGRSLAIAMADLDHFKEVNDTHGHLVGDVVLRRIGRVLRRSLRRTDLSGRYGGEEFLLVLPETSGEAALEVIEGLRVRVEELEVETPDGRGVRTTVSVGVAALSELPADGDAGQLLRMADSRLYQAKGAGRNRIAREDIAS